jgi:hypothetical protein
MLDDAREEDNVLQPLDKEIRLIDSLALRHVIQLIERVLCPWLKLRVFFFRNRKNTNFRFQGVDYGLSLYLSSIWEVMKQCLTSSVGSYQ